MKKIVLFTIVLLFAWPSVRAEIIVRQDKDGTKLITNVHNKWSSKNYKKKKKRTGKAGQVKPSRISVPREYLLKIKKLAKKYKLDEALIQAVAMAESGFNRYAVSRKGAVGIMQLMKSTAKQYGVSDRYNADQNMEAGVKHLKYLYKKYNKDLALTLAAYNAGEEAVKKYGGVPPFKETRNYIKRIMKYMGLSAGGYFNAKFSTKIYQYRTLDGKIMITDSRPSTKVGGVIVHE